MAKSLVERKIAHVRNAPRLQDLTKMPGYAGSPSKNLAAQPTGCLGFLCPEKSDACDCCEIVAETEVLDLPTLERDPFLSLAEEPQIGSPHKAIIYTQMAAPANRGAVLSKILDSTP